MRATRSHLSWLCCAMRWCSSREPQDRPPQDSSDEIVGHLKFTAVARHSQCDFLLVGYPTRAREKWATATRRVSLAERRVRVQRPVPLDPCPRPRRYGWEFHDEHAPSSASFASSDLTFATCSEPSPNARRTSSRCARNASHAAYISPAVIGTGVSSSRIFILQFCVEEFRRGRASRGPRPRAPASRGRCWCHSRCVRARRLRRVLRLA